MPTTHIVSQGEYLLAIAQRHGFADYHTIWDHPDNQELKQLRKNPDVLFPGDTLIIPEPAPASRAGQTEQINRFVLASATVALNFLFENASRQPIADRSGQLKVGGLSPKGTFVVQGPLLRTTDGDGMLKEKVKKGSPTEGEFAMDPAKATPPLPPDTFRFLVGSLDPVDTPPGQRARLNNLGYFAGYTESDSQQLAWATEEFQCDEKMPKTQRGVFADRKKNLPTWNRLAKKHGDMLEGEELTE